MRAWVAWALSLGLGAAGFPLAMAWMDPLLGWLPEGVLPRAARFLLAAVPFSLALAAPRPLGVVAGVAFFLAVLAVLVGAGVRWVDGPFDALGLALLFGFMFALPGAILGAGAKALWRAARRGPGPG